MQLRMHEGAPQILAHTHISLCWALKSILRSDKVSASPAMDPSRITEELQEVVLVTQLMAVFPLVQH